MIHNPRSGVFMDRMAYNLRGQGIAFSGLGVDVLCGPKIERYIAGRQSPDGCDLQDALANNRVCLPGWPQRRNIEGGRAPWS